MNKEVEEEYESDYENNPIDEHQVDLEEEEQSEQQSQIADIVKKYPGLDIENVLSAKVNTISPTNKEDPILAYKEEIEKNINYNDSDSEVSKKSESIEEPAIQPAMQAVEKQEGISFKEYQELNKPLSSKKSAALSKTSERPPQRVKRVESVKKTVKPATKPKQVKKKVPKPKNFRKVEAETKQRFEGKKAGEPSYNNMTYSIIKKRKDCEEKKRPSQILNRDFRLQQSNSESEGL